MSVRWLFFLFLLPMCMPLHSLAQTMDYHIGVGMGRSRSTPPEVIDMRWAHKYLDMNATGAANATGASNATRKDVNNGDDIRIGSDQSPRGQGK